MTNFEMYRDELLNLAQEGKYIVISKTGQPVVSDYPMLLSELIKWGFDKYKRPPLKFSKLEYELLKRITEFGFKFIARDKKGTLCVYEGMPVKDLFMGQWDNNAYDYDEVVEQFYSFPFVRWEDAEPTNIEAILKNCEVVNDD